jgi:hypothetical protein
MYWLAQLIVLMALAAPLVIIGMGDGPGIKTAVRLVLLAYIVSIGVILCTGWLWNLFDFRSWNLFEFIAAPTIGIITLAAFVYGAVKHRSLWWIIPCEGISLVAFTLVGLTLLAGMFDLG